MKNQVSERKIGKSNGLIVFNVFLKKKKKSPYSYVEVGHRNDFTLQFLFWNFNFGNVAHDVVEADLLGILMLTSW